MQAISQSNNSKSPAPVVKTKTAVSQKRPIYLWLKENICEDLPAGVLWGWTHHSQQEGEEEAKAEEEEQKVETNTSLHKQDQPLKKECS